MEVRRVTAAVTAGVLALVGLAASASAAPPSPQAGDLGAVEAAADQVLAFGPNGAVTGGEVGAQQEPAGFVCSFSGSITAAPYPFDPTAIAYVATSFCGGNELAAIESLSVQAFVYDAETGALVAEAELESALGSEATAVTSNGGLGNVERPGEYFVHVETVSTLTEASGMTWGFAPSVCEGVGTRVLSCAWDGPSIFF